MITYCYSFIVYLKLPPIANKTDLNIRAIDLGSKLIGTDLTIYMFSCWFSNLSILNFKYCSFKNKMFIIIFLNFLLKKNCDINKLCVKYSIAKRK